MNPRITIISGDRRLVVEAEPDETLLATLGRTGWHLPAPCGGMGRCGKCRVTVTPPEAAGPRDAREERFTGPEPAERLACLVVPEADLEVVLPETAVAPERADALAKGGAIEMPAAGRLVVTLERLQIEPGSLEDQRSLLSRIRDAAGEPDLEVPLDLLRAVANHGDPSTELELLMDGAHVSGAHGNGAHGTALELPLAGGADVMEALALAFDIGTTTVAGYLVDLSTHTVRASRSAPNAQGTYGADVISRMTAYENGSPLHPAICDQLARMTRDLARSGGVSPEAISTATIVGNTTMMHLLLDLDPGPMSRAPFLPALTESLLVPAAEIDLPIHQRSRVRILPGVSAYVGADIVADLISSGMHTSEGVSLLVDIGTNGEIVCGGSGILVACSTAAGPAFEGATIRHGSGGIDGAIDHVRREDDRIIVETIGGSTPGSICGTGLMDAVAMLLADGVVDETGRMDGEQADSETQARYAQHLTTVDGEPAVILAPAPPQDGRGEPIVLTQSDVRHVQLAKGAIAAGIRVLLEETNTTPDDLRAVYLAGGFGTYVRPASAVRVGLLPGIAPERVIPLGNAAGAGAARVLVDDTSPAEADAIAADCRYVELSGSAAFQNYYMEEMLFPGS